MSNATTMKLKPDIFHGMQVNKNFNKGLNDFIC